MCTIHAKRAITMRREIQLASSRAASLASAPELADASCSKQSRTGAYEALCCLRVVMVRKKFHTSLRRDERQDNFRARLALFQGKGHIAQRHTNDAVAIDSN